MKTEFVIRPYSKTELALLYTNKTMTPERAKRWLSHEIEVYPGLKERLKELGYKPKQRIFGLIVILQAASWSEYRNSGRFE